MKKQIIFLGVGAGALGIILGRLFKKYKQAHERHYILIGDIGGTNIRLRLVQISTGDQRQAINHKSESYMVQNFDNLSDALQVFLIGCHFIPQIAVIGIAGLVMDNKVRMGNVPKWGLIDGTQLGKKLNIKKFRFIEDFQAATYGISMLKKQNLSFIKGKQMLDGKPRGVIGAGTGLGASILFQSYFKGQKIINVLPNEQGQSDYYHIDQETEEYYEFLKKKTGKSFITIERSFCGPALPLMFQFYMEKYPNSIKDSSVPTSFEIIQYCVKNDKESSNQENPYFRTVKLFLKLYQNVIGNFIAHHMCTGGVYLNGSLSKAVLPIIEKEKFLDGYLKRHPQIQEAVINTPIAVCEEVQLGLEGALVYAKNILKGIYS